MKKSLVILVFLMVFLISPLLAFLVILLIFAIASKKIIIEISGLGLVLWLSGLSLLLSLPDYNIGDISVYHERIEDFDWQYIANLKNWDLYKLQYFLDPFFYLVAYLVKIGDFPLGFHGFIYSLVNYVLIFILWKRRFLYDNDRNTSIAKMALISILILSAPYNFLISYRFQTAASIILFALLSRKLVIPKIIFATTVHTSALVWLVLQNKRMRILILGIIFAIFLFVPPMNSFAIAKIERYLSSDGFWTFSKPQRYIFFIYNIMWFIALIYFIPKKLKKYRILIFTIGLILFPFQTIIIRSIYVIKHWWVFFVDKEKLPEIIGLSFIWIIIDYQFWYTLIFADFKVELFYGLLIR